MHCCYFCKQWVYRIPHHLRFNHKKEDKVIVILKQSRKQQNIEFTKLRRLGDFEANMEKVRGGENLVAVVRKSKSKLWETIVLV